MKRNIWETKILKQSYSQSQHLHIAINLGDLEIMKSHHLHCLSKQVCTYIEIFDSSGVLRELKQMLRLVAKSHKSQSQLLFYSPYERARFSPELMSPQFAEVIDFTIYRETNRTWKPFALHCMHLSH